MLTTAGVRDLVAPRAHRRTAHDTFLLNPTLRFDVTVRSAHHHARRIRTPIRTVPRCLEHIPMGVYAQGRHRRSIANWECSNVPTGHLQGLLEDHLGWVRPACRAGHGRRSQGAAMHVHPPAAGGSHSGCVGVEQAARPQLSPSPTIDGCPAQARARPLGGW